MIIDCHSHITAPPELGSFHQGLFAARGAHGRRPRFTVSDERVEGALNAPTFRGPSHLQRLKDVGTDLQLISPRPFTLAHYAQPHSINESYVMACNDLIAQQCKLHPEVFRGVCALPQEPGASPSSCLEELERCVNELGFVGCLINPDPGERGTDETPAMGSEFWYPLYEKMVELDVPGLIHTASCQSTRLTYSLHFINEESIAICSLLGSRVFEDFPTLKIVVSHGGGAIPYQMGRFMASHYNSGGPRWENLVKQLYYDTCLYTKDGLELLFKVMGSDRCMFGTENPGTGSAKHPDTGRWLDDTRPVIESIDWLTEQDKRNIFEENARRVHSRLAVAAAV